MDKNAIKSFAIESRRQMIESVKYQASLIGIGADGISEPISKAEGMETYDYGAGTYTIFDDDIIKRKSLVREVTNKGFDNVVEEVAYTWFNRILAIRFMEVNDYLPNRTRVLSSEVEGKTEPDIITDALDLDLDFSIDDKELIFKLKDENKLDELFQFLFIKQCNKLNEILPGLFEKTDDYMELLLDISFVNDNGIVRQLINNISEEDFGDQVEIIGWLYQYYNTELKDDTFKDSNVVKVQKDRIPAVTQMFTPDWIVKYMVENSLGRLWLEGHSNSTLKSKWEYYIDDINQDDKDVDRTIQAIKKDSENLILEDIKIIDPSMGSGHILVYVFDILMDIYLSEGYTKHDAVISILNNNIYGLDIDDRAYQLSYFALMMKARSYSRKIFTENVYPSICSFKETKFLDTNLINAIKLKYPQVKEDLDYLISTFYDAKDYGSIIKFHSFDLNSIKECIINDESNDLLFIKNKDLLLNLISQAEFLSQKYDVVITNPPYMSVKKMNSKLREYINSNYPISKYDFYSVFIEKGFDLIKENMINCMVTMQTWMFLSSYEKFRREILNKSTIIQLLHLDNGILTGFGASATIFRKVHIPNFKGQYNNIQIKDIDSVSDIPYNFPVVENQSGIVSIELFEQLPQMPIAYWGDTNLIGSFSKGKPLSSISAVHVGLVTGNNKKFLRYWFEVDNNTIGFDHKDSKDIMTFSKKWFPYHKGGLFRKWYGNALYVINMENEGLEIKSSGKKSVRLRDPKFYFKKSLHWTLKTSKLSFRYYDNGFLFDHNVGGVFLDNEDYYYWIVGLCNSNICQSLLDLIAPPLHFESGHISNLPMLFDNSYLVEVNDLVKQAIELTKEDWDESELSFNFECHPFIKSDEVMLEKSFENLELSKEKLFNSLYSIESRLEEIFCDIYNVNEDNEIDDKYISISKKDYETEVKSFISYSVGCMFGRYSLDELGIKYAGGEFNLNDYSKFTPDDDNIIPVLDTEYFTDDIVGRFVKFVKICFGEENLEENLDFIAGALNKKGKTSREKIRNYFLTDFFKDHAQSYKKCPIYWQFDSGKQNAFNCLIYMHRYDPSIVARVRTDYLHKTQKAIEQNLVHCDNIIANSSNKSEISKATKDKTKYIKQLDEIRVYDEALGHMANQHIEIDLDDGVKVNYAKFQKIEVSIEGEKPKKINLLKNI